MTLGELLIFVVQNDIPFSTKLVAGTGDEILTNETGVEDRIVIPLPG